MIEVSPSTGWFSDRPVREAGQMATADFVSLWAEGGTFAADPPNADFACQVDGATVNVVVELSSPVVNGRTLTYDTVRVGDTPDGNYDCDSNATGTAATFQQPFGVAVDTAGNVYVADSSNQLIRKISPAGDVTTLAGTANTTGAINATGTNATFDNPLGVAVNTDDNVYVADGLNHLIRKIN